MNIQTESVLPHIPNKVIIAFKVTVNSHGVTDILYYFTDFSLQAYKAGTTGLPHSTEKETES